LVTKSAIIIKENEILQAELNAIKLNRKCSIINKNYDYKINSNDGQKIKKNGNSILLKNRDSNCSTNLNKNRKISDIEIGNNDKKINTKNGKRLTNFNVFNNDIIPKNKLPNFNPRLSNLAISPIKSNIKNLRENRKSINKPFDNYNTNKKNKVEDLTISSNVISNEVKDDTNKRLVLNNQFERINEETEIREKEDIFGNEIIPCKNHSGSIFSNIETVSEADKESLDSQDNNKSINGFTLCSVFFNDDEDNNIKRNIVYNNINKGTIDDQDNKNLSTNKIDNDSKNNNNILSKLSEFSYNNRQILQDLDSKIKDINTLNDYCQNNNNLNEDPKFIRRRNKISVLFNKQTSIIDKNTKKKKESISQTVAFNMKVNIKQKKNNFNYGNYIKQIKDKNGKLEKLKEVVSKKYEMKEKTNEKHKKNLSHILLKINFFLL